MKKYPISRMYLGLFLIAVIVGIIMEAILTPITIRLPNAMERIISAKEVSRIVNKYIDRVKELAGY